MLNSSTACFWLKQNSHDKGGDSIGDEAARLRSSLGPIGMSFTGTTLQDFPLPESLPLNWGRTLDSLARQLADAYAPLSSAGPGMPTREALDQARRQSTLVARTHDYCAGGAGLGGLPALRLVDEDLTLLR